MVCDPYPLQQGALEKASTLQVDAGSNNGALAIHPRFNNLITVLCTAVENGKGMLDKVTTSHDDCFAFRLSLVF